MTGDRHVRFSREREGEVPSRYSPGCGYLAGYLWLALFPLFGSIAGAVYMATRRAARAPAPESQP